MRFRIYERLDRVRTEFIWATMAVIAIVSLTGYVLNIYKLTQLDEEKPYVVGLVRALGVLVPPVGTVVGYLTLKDGANDEQETTEVVPYAK